jgi:ParB family transcriptional regulator, chromosome partitioning protein
MMTTSAAEKVGGEKKDEKVEKRRALGRGLASLLPGPRVVSTASPQELKPESSLSSNGTLRPGSGQASEAVPFANSLPAEGGGGDGETKIPRFARNDNPLGVRNDKSEVESPASAELEASRTGVSDPHEHGEVISISAVADASVPGDSVAHLPLDSIDKNPYQTRYVFDEEMLWELRDSIKEHGVVQPIVVRPAEEEGRYILVLGERRLRASKMAEVETIPALVRRVSPQQAAEMTVLENMVREDLNPIEQAEAFRVLSLEFKLTQAEIADRIGVSRETVSNYMRLLRLPKKVMDYMLSERISFSDAREILRLENDDYIEQVADEVVEHKLKWDQIEDRVMRINGSFAMLPGQTLPGEPRKKSGARWMDPNVRAAQTDMERTLGMRVRIRDRHGKGKIVIEYATVDDYERVTSMLRGKK